MAEQHEKRCGGYVGVACVDGSCPVANAEEGAVKSAITTKGARIAPWMELSIARKRRIKSWEL